MKRLLLLALVVVATLWARAEGVVSDHRQRLDTG